MKRNARTALWAVAQAILAIAAAIAVYSAFFSGPRKGVHELHVLATNDVHGAWFDSTYTGSGVRSSLFAVSRTVDSIRAAVGPRNVLLLDAGDCLQGDNAAYYYNYVATAEPHLFPRLAAYMGYDAIAVGNHDIETGHPVYDRVTRQLRRKGIAFLAGNAFRTDGRGTYWSEYKVFRRSGMKVLVAGYTNAYIASWLGEDKWSGMSFSSLVPLVGERVARLRRRFRPDVVVVAVHSGTGKGDGSELESQGMDLFRSLEGVDFVICSHDHRSFVSNSGSCVLLNSGSRASNVAHGVLKAKVKGRRIVSREYSCGLEKTDPHKVDTAMKAAFRADFEKVRDFTLAEVGGTECELSMREAFRGPCAMLDLIHTVQLLSSGAQVSFAAPLSQKGLIPAGKLIYNDLFVIYPYENTLFKVKLTGEQIVSYLEYSYDAWIQDPSSGHVLRIESRGDDRFGNSRWSFVNRSYNFDSAAGLRYTVDVTKPFGSRVAVSSMADGSAFERDSVYTVAMTSYRAAGGGGLLREGAGADPATVPVEGRYPEIRDLVYQFIKDRGTLTAGAVSDSSLLGGWSFVPSPAAQEAIDADMKLLFR